MKRISSFFLAAVLSAAMTAHAEGWRDPAGNLLGDTEERQSKDGFGGWVLVTADQDWTAKWNAAADTTPVFSKANSLRLGERIFVLIFFTNPLLTMEREAEVTCDIRVVRPNGTISIDAPGVPCFDGVVEGPTTNVFLSSQLVAFVGEQGDPLGVWQVEVTLKDRQRGTELPLRTSFELR